MRLYRFGIVITSALLLGVNTANAGIKCWENDEGVRECGNSVPAKYAQKGHSTITTLGTEKKTARAKTPEEIAAERAEKARIDAENAEKQRIAAEQAKRDRVLLNTFASESDLELTRNSKLQALDIRIKHVGQIVEKMEKDLERLRNEAANQERSGKKVSPQLMARINHAEDQTSENMKSIQQHEKDKIQLNKKFDEDLARYRELKGTKTVSSQ